MMEQVEKLLKSYEEEMVKTLQDLVRVPSVDGEPKEGMPFGEECAKVLALALQKAQDMGFETYNDENYAGHVAYGKGEKTLGILAHLDVVPEGEDWTVPPYEAFLKDGYMYGRGTTDNKCSCVSCLYALRAIKEAGIELNDRVLLIMGCNEEKGSADMAHYMKHVGMPDYGFSPDSSFPVCYAEKGIQRVEITAPFGADHPIVSIEAGQAVNIVPNRCKATVKGCPKCAKRITDKAAELNAPCTVELHDGLIDVTIEGKASHGAWPQGGRNAISLMAEALSALNLGDAKPAIDLLRSTLGEHDWDGAKLGINFTDEHSGALSCNMGVIRANEQGLLVKLDIRQPVTITFDQVLSAIRAAIAPYGGTAESKEQSAPLYQPIDGELVSTMMKVYKEVTGRDEQPYYMGGGTYAKSMHNCVAFGPSLPGSKSGGAHGPDEKLYLEEMFTAAQIYAKTIVALAGRK